MTDHHTLEEMTAMTAITVYSKPSCVQCNATCKRLDKHGLEYTIIDISVDEQAREYVMALGHLNAPVVVVDHGGEIDHWSGFVDRRIDALASAVNTAA